MKFYDPSKPVEIRRGSLPHWYQEGALYFVTFRLFDSFPQRILKVWQGKLLDLQNSIDRGDPGIVVRRIKKRLIRRYHRYLDLGLGSCVLRSAPVNAIVLEAIRYFSDERYQLDEHTVAPNHVHALVAPIPPWTLPKVLHSWKSFSSHEILKLPAARQLLGEAIGGPVSHVWQSEGFDHIVRNERSLQRFRAYIRNHKR